MADLGTDIEPILDADLADDVRVPVRKAATPGWLYSTLSQLAFYTSQKLFGALTGQAGKAVVVNEDETGFIFGEASSGGGDGGSGGSGTGSWVPPMVHLSRNANLAILQDVWTPIPWDTEIRDDLGGWAAGDPTKIFVPTGVTRVRITALIIWQGSSSGLRYVAIAKNSQSQGASFFQVSKSQAWQTGEAMTTGWIDCAPGDYFSVLANQQGQASLNIMGLEPALPNQHSYIQVEFDDGTAGGGSGGGGGGGGGQASEATFTKPTLADFPIKVGVDTAPSVAVDTPLGINIYTTEKTAVEKWHILGKPVPAAYPFDIVARVNDLNPSVNYHSLGLVVRAADGKMITFEQIDVDATSKFEINRWNNSAHVNADLSYNWRRGEKFPWLRMQVYADGLLCYISKDGLAWNMIASIDGSNRAWIGTITEIGFGVKASIAPASQYTGKVNAHLLSFDTKVPTTVPASGGGAPGKVAAEATFAPVLTNGYVDLGNGYQPVRAFKTGRLVTLTGVMKGPDGVVAFTLPEGWRPAQSLHGVDNHGDVLGRWDLFADGRYLPAGGNPASFACVNVTYEVAEADGEYQMVGGGSGGGGGSAGRSIVNLDKDMLPLASFTELGTGGSRTIRESAGKALTMVEANPVAGAKVFGLFKEPPVGPYLIALYVQQNVISTFHGAAIGWTDGVGAFKLATFVSTSAEYNTWSSPTNRTANAAYNGGNPLRGPGTGAWLGLEFDGTNHWVCVSQDGVNFTRFGKYTPAEIGTTTKPFIGMYSETNGSTGGVERPNSVSYLIYDEDGLNRDFG